MKIRLGCVLGISLACVASTGACFDVSELSGDDAGTDAGSDVATRDVASGDTSTTVGAVPPSLPSGTPTATATTEHNFAVATLLLGDVPRGSSNQSPTAWKDYGYNLDGKISTVASTDLCTPAAGAQKSTVYQDGTNGIDNSFGENILPIFLSTGGNDLASMNNQAIQNGLSTIEIDVTGLADDPTQTNAGVHGYLNPAGSFDADAGLVPSFTISDSWPVLNTLLGSSTTPADSSSTFPNAYVASGTWVSAPYGSWSADLPITLWLSGTSFSFTVHDAVVTFDHTSETMADNGTIAGVLHTEEFIDAFRLTAGRISSQLCSGATFDSIAQQIRQASDILSNGTNQAGVPCDGISIGLGFKALEIGAQAKVVAPAPQSDPCADGG